jgi:hypothetical protein
MIRLLPLLPVFVLVVALAGCGAVNVAFVSTPGGHLTVSGTVVVAQLGFADDGHGTVVGVTLVTLDDLGITKTMAFCGDQRAQFPTNQNLRADFISGTLCSTLVTVVFCAPTANTNAAPTGLFRKTHESEV